MGKIRCPLRAPSMTLDRDRPEILLTAFAGLLDSGEIRARWCQLWMSAQDAVHRCKVGTRFVAYCVALVREAEGIDTETDITGLELRKRQS